MLDDLATTAGRCRNLPNNCELWRRSVSPYNAGPCESQDREEGGGASHDASNATYIRTRIFPFITLVGNEWEDSSNFLRLVINWCQAEEILETDWTIWTADQLRCEAFTWYQNFRGFDWPFHIFRQRFLERFDSLSIRTKLQAKLFGQRQTNEESALFIARKKRIVAEIRIGIRGSISNRADKAITATRNKAEFNRRSNQ